MFFRRKTSFSENDLESVIQACLSRDQAAEKALIKLFLGFAKGIVFRYAANKQEAEEMINDVFMKVFSNLSKYDTDQPFKAWLRRIVVNTAIDYYRKNQKYIHQVDIEEFDFIDFNEDIISKISAEEILSLVQKLPSSYRMAFTLFVIDGYSHKEIAEMLEIKEGTSKSNLQDARKKLQKMIINAYPHLHLAYGLNHYKINEN